VIFVVVVVPYAVYMLRSCFGCFIA